MRASYIIRRVVFLFMVIWTAATINFILPRLTGRNPIRETLQQQIASQGRKPADAKIMLDKYNELFGLNKPLWEQYVIYISGVFRLDFGYSIMLYPRTVMEIIIDRGKLTLPFIVVGVIIAFFGGVLLGALIGWKKTPKWIGNIIIPFLMIFGSIPQFLVAIILIFFLAFRAKLFPLGDPYTNTLVVNWGNPKFILDYAYHAVLPVMCIVLVEASGWALGMRAMMVTVEGEDYTTFAEARGLKGSRIFYRYLIRNAFLPPLTSLAIRLGFIITGAAVTENFFNYNGLGQTLASSITQFDYFMIYGIVIIMVMSIAIATFVIDMIYPLLDPRIAYRGQRG
jgi:peptide/nickel transport system permease protein